jgi:phenylacetate-CoA ligase
MLLRTLFNSLYSLYETHVQGRQTFRYLLELEATQWLPLAELEKIQLQRLQLLLQHAEQQSPYYTAIFKQLNFKAEDIKSIDDLRKLPVIGRAEVVAHQADMEARNHQGQLMYKTTGGSTGMPVKLALDRKSYEWRTAVTQRGYRWAGCDIRNHTMYIWSGDVGKKSLSHRIKNALYHWTLNREMFNCFNFGPQEMQSCVDYINTHKPSGIVAFTTPLYNLACFIRDNNIKINRSVVKGMVTGAERLFDYQRDTIENAIGGKVFNTYGCREFMLVAAECDHHKGLHVNIDSLVVEVLVDGRPALPGETGEIVITDLNNYGMPFIRYKNGDLATVGDAPCTCGRGFPLLKDIDGRIVDVLLATDGRKVAGTILPHVMKEIVEVLKYQAVQKTRSLLEIKIVLKAPLSEERQQFLRQELQKVMGSGMTIAFNFVDDIPLNASGKFRMTINEVTD